MANYAYDGLGRRSWAQMANGRTVLRVYSQDGRLLFTNDSLKGATRHIHLGDKVVAETNTLSGTRWLHSDALGSPVASTGPAGQLLDRTRYEPYGLTAAGTNPDGIGFTGHVNDVDTGLVYMQQRYYDPIAGRFLSVDPVTTNAGDGSFFNRYVYTNNNPYKFKDPDGRAPGSFDCDCSGGTTNAGLPVSPIVTLQILAIQNGVSPAAVQAVTAIATAAVTRGGGAKANSANATAGTGRGANKLGPVKEAQGAHSTFKTDADGKVTNTATYTPNPKNPSGHDEVKRVDVTGTAHTNSDGTKVPTPRLHEAGQKDVRPARPEEQPK